MQEQRFTLRLLKYWELLRKSHHYPDIIQLNPSAIEEMWPFCFRVSVIREPGLSYKYEYMGEPIAELYGRDLTGVQIDGRMAHLPGAILHKKLEEVVHAGTPLQDHGHFPNDSSSLIKYRACLLPFGNERDGLTHILVGMSCRAF